MLISAAVLLYFIIYPSFSGSALMNFETFLQTHHLILTECAISERLRRQPDIELHPTLFNTPLIYDDLGSIRLAEIYLSYRHVAEQARLPIILCAPTWRVDQKRIDEAGIAKTINRDAVDFLKGLQTTYTRPESPIVVGSLLAPKNDCYDPDAALQRREAAEYHSWQIDELATVGAEVIVAQTMPALSESVGMADRLALSGVPYIISFVINRFGNLLDHTPLAEAIDRVDQQTAVPPAGYMVNCVYPTFLDTAKNPEVLQKRLVGIQANASSKDHDQLDGAEQLHQDPLEDWGKHMVRLHRKLRINILGGCCGTDDSYLQYLVSLLQ